MADMASAGSSPSLNLSADTTEDARPAPWQRAATGANLLSPEGNLGVTIFEEMTTLALSTGAINLGQGFPDEDGPAEIKAAARSAIASGANQYAPGKGVPVLREAIASHQQRFYGLTPDPDTEVLVTTGATEAIAATLLAFIQPGDEVLTFEPFYDSYGAIIGMAGGKHVTAPLLAPDFLQCVAHRIQEILVGGDDAAVEIELDYGLGFCDGGRLSDRALHRGFFLRIEHVRLRLFLPKGKVGLQ